MDARRELLVLDRSVETISADVYLDGTVSMAGYVTSPDSEYLQFLETLERVLTTGWKRADVQFFKFGTKVRELEDRAAYREARDPAFYRERGIMEETQIDSVISCGQSGRIGIVITDLFQTDGDVQAVVQTIKDRCFIPGDAVGILGVPSQFAGMVYDARVPPYRYESEVGNPESRRPFYALVFGDVAQMHRLHQLIEASMSGTVNFALIAPRMVTDYTVELTRAGESRGLNANTSPGPGEFSFSIIKGVDGGALPADLALSLYPHAPNFRIDDVSLVVRGGRLPSGGNDDSAGTAETTDLSLESITRKGDTLHATLRLRPPNAPGTYEYDASLVTGVLDGFAPPAWVSAFSSTNPVPGEDANKTLNLERFVTDLRRSSSTVHRPVLATWKVRVRRL